MNPTVINKSSSLRRTLVRKLVMLSKAKHLVFLAFALTIQLAAHSQIPNYYIVANNTVLKGRGTGDNELYILNSTKNVAGYLKNDGTGKTSFQVAVDSIKQVNDSTIRVFSSGVSNDLVIHTGSGGSSVAYVDSVYTHTGPLVDTVLYKKNGTIYNVGYIDHTDGGRISGLEVTYSGAGLKYDVTAGVVRIDGQRDTSPGGQVTLSPADAGNPRWDLIAVDNTGAIIVIEGDPASDPLKPQIDPATQFELTSVLVNAGDTIPSNITQTIVYDENIEWPPTVTAGLTVNFNNTSHVFHGAKSADVGSWSTTKTIIFTNANTLTSTNYSEVKFYADLKAAIPNASNIRVTFLNGNTAVSNVLTLTGAYGFSKTDTGYRNISIPISAFTFSNSSFNKIRIAFVGSGSGLYLDYVQLQSGLINTTVETDPVALAKTITVNPGSGISITGNNTQALGSNPVFTINNILDISGKLNISDSASMLSNYVRRIYRSHDSVYYVKASGAVFAYIDSTGGGVGGTSGIDDVLAMAQSLSANRAINLNTHDLTLSGGTNLTLSSNNTTYIEAINKNTSNSLDSSDVLAANVLRMASVRVLSQAATTNIWGYSTTKTLTATSAGIAITGDLFSSATTNKPTLVDTATGLISHGFIDQASQITGITPPVNGGTGLVSPSANSLLAGNGASAFNLIAPGTSGNVLTSNGTSWASTATAANYWAVGQYESLASTNIVKLASAVNTDSVAIGNTIATLRGKVNFGGRVYSEGVMSVGGGAFNTSYALSVNGGIVSSGQGLFNGTIAVNTTNNPNSAIGITIATANAPTAINVTGATSNANAAQNSILIQQTPNQISAASGTSFTAFNATISNQTDGSTTQTSEFYRGFYANVTTKSSCTTPLGALIGFEAGTATKISTGTGTATKSYNFKADGLTGNTSAELTAGGNHYSYFADSFTASLYTGAKVWGIYQRANVANTIYNYIGGTLSLGTADSTQSTAAILQIGAGTTGLSQLRFMPGVAPTSPNDGDDWYEDINDRLMFRQNATSVELLGASAVNTVSPTTPDRTITIKINGTTYYISAKTTND